MLNALHTEGFHISDRELLRLRLRFKWLLRESRAKDPSTSSLASHPHPQTDQHEVTQLHAPPNEANSPVAPTSSSNTLLSTAPTLPIDEAELHRRHLKHEALLRTSAEKYLTRTRRRRTRPWAGLPADAPGAPPRFPSETTLSEAQSYLSLTSTDYRTIRQSFQALCEADGVLKKKIAGPHKWSELKRRLVAENECLRAAFEGDEEATQQLDSAIVPAPSNRKALALDVICTDVTKRLRSAGTQVGIPDAKIILGLNPAEAREVRSALHGLLKADRFPSKHETGEEHWAEVKRGWIGGSELLRRVLAGGDEDPKIGEKTRALDVIARDVVKRFRAEERRAKSPKEPSTARSGTQEAGIETSVPGASTATGSHTTQAGASNQTHNSKKKHTHPPPPLMHPTPASVSNFTTLSDFAALASAGDLQIDPSLLLAASDPSLLAPTGQGTIRLSPRLQSQPYNQRQM